MKYYAMVLAAVLLLLTVLAPLPMEAALRVAVIAVKGMVCDS